jgi:predicted amidohydrolase
VVTLPGSLTVGVAQLAPTQDAPSNLARIRELTLAARRSATDLLVFPELSMTGWGASAEANAKLAHPLDGDVISELANVATDAGITVIAGLYEVSDNSELRPYNTLLAVAPGAGVVATHRKVHLYDAFGYRETDEVQPGAGALATITVQGVKIGIVNCYEVRFPERAFALAEVGCEVLTVSAAWPSGPYKEEHWELNVRARAIENQVWVAGSSSTGPEVIGRSLVADPMGVIRAQLDASSDQWAAVEVSPECLERARTRLPVHKQRRAYYYAAPVNRP